LTLRTWYTTCRFEGIPRFVVVPRLLHLADHAYPVAIGARDIEPVAVDRLTAARHLVLAAIHFRRTLDVAAEPMSVPVPVPVPVDDSDGGRLTPVTPVPFSRPPAPRKVEINF
jgi:hypothetical protein